MTEKRKALTAVVSAALMLLAIPAFAQVAQKAESNTRRATFTNFSTDVDRFMDPFTYSSIEFDKFFTYAGFTSGFEFGYAKRMNSGNYLGLLYRGTMFTQTDATATETLASTWNSNGELLTVTNTISYDSQNFHSNNSVAALLGMGAMGIKFGFYERTDTLKNPDTFVLNTDQHIAAQNGTGTDYTNKIVEFVDNDLSFVPYVGFGMTLANGMTPYVNIEFAINSDKETKLLSDYTESNGTYSTRTSEGKYLNNSNLVLNAVAGVGIPSFMKEWDLKLEYNINVGIWNNDYDIMGLTGNVKGTVSTVDPQTGKSDLSVSENYGNVSDYIRRSTTFFINERKSARHVITPSLKKNFALNDMTDLALTCLLPVTIGSATNGKIEKTHTYTEGIVKYDTASTLYTEAIDTVYGGEDVTSTFAIEPSLKAGVRVKLIPNRMNINAGLRFDPVHFSRQRIRTTPNGYDTSELVQKDGYGTILVNDFNAADVNAGRKDDVLKTVTNWSPLVQYAVGLSFFFTPTFCIDTIAESAFGGESFAEGIDVSTLRVLFSIKK